MLSRSDSRTAPNTSSKACRNLGQMFHLSVSMDTVPQRVIRGQRHADHPLRGYRRAGFPGRPGPLGGGSAEALPAGRHGRAACPWGLPPQRYTQRQSPDVPPQSPVQGLPHVREITAARPPHARRASHPRGGPMTDSRRRHADPRRPGTGRPLSWLMRFMVIYCRFIHNPGCSALISS